MAQFDPTLFERTTDGVVLPSKLEPVVWTIPAKEAKNGLAHEVPLSGALIGLLRDLATRDEEERIGATASQAVRLQVRRPRSAPDRGDAAGGRRGAENFIPKVLNHVQPGVTRRHDTLHAYRSEKRAALETGARYLQAILTNKQPATATVVPFRR